MIEINKAEKLLNLGKQYPKFEKFLQHAVEIWLTKANPIQQAYGVGQSFSSNNFFEFDDDRNPECCLIGAATVGKKIPEHDSKHIDEWDAVCIENFNLYSDDLVGILAGFDDSAEANLDEVNKEAYEFASEVRKILFEE